MEKHANMNYFIYLNDSDLESQMANFSSSMKIEKKVAIFTEKREIKKNTKEEEDFKVNRE